MGYNRQQSVSKPLLITLVVVAVIGAIWFAKTRMDQGSETKVDIPPPPPGLTPATPRPGEPSPVTLGGGAGKK